MNTKQHPSKAIVILTGVLALLIFIAFLARFGKEWFVSARRVDLSGTWQLTLPAGFVKHMTIERLENNVYFLRPLNFAGEYELQEKRLVMVKPVDPRLTEFVWKLRDDDSLLLVEEPPAAKTGARYKGAVLRRESAEHQGPAR